MQNLSSSFWNQVVLVFFSIDIIANPLIFLEIYSILDIFFSNSDCGKLLFRDATLLGVVNKYTKFIFWEWI